MDVFLNHLPLLTEFKMRRLFLLCHKVCVVAVALRGFSTMSFAVSLRNMVLLLEHYSICQKIMKNSPFLLLFLQGIVFVLQSRVMLSDYFKGNLTLSSLRGHHTLVSLKVLDNDIAIRAFIHGLSILRHSEQLCCRDSTDNLFSFSALLFAF